MIAVKKVSDFTGVEHTRDIPITPEAYEAWLSGEHMVQDLFPYLSADDREFLMTGVTPEEWNAVFGDPDEDDYGEEEDNSPTGGVNEWRTEK